jgi:hypothetical protein
MSEPRQIPINAVTVTIAIFVPIVAALLAAFVPYAVKYFRPEHKLECQLNGPISTKDIVAIQLIISNNGEKVEKGVKIWLKSSLHAAERVARRSQAVEGNKYPTDFLSISTKSWFSLATEGDQFVISIGDVRPKEKVDLSVAVRDIGLIVGCLGNQCFGIEVKSDEHVAAVRGQLSHAEGFPLSVIWVVVALLLYLIFFSIYQQIAGNKPKA